uniref:Apolipoprotein N n=1 Tax=Cricetulus griseus TaxID=10029 RepID=A0A8C2LE31_CRIGR
GCIAPWLLTAFPRDTQNGSLPLQPALTETEPTSNVIFGQISPPAPGTCQDLLYTVSSLALLSEYLSLLAVRVTLEDIGCPTEAHYLQLQLRKDNSETLILESQKHSKEEGIGNNEAILRDLGGSLRVLYETGSLLTELAEKLPSTDVVRAYKASVVIFTQQCTIESWEHLIEVHNRIIKSPEVENATISIEDQVYVIAQLAILVKHVFMGLVLNNFQSYFG